jgi:hypothetical protein
MTTHQSPANVFIASALADTWCLRQLEAHLSMLKREGGISTWCNRQLMPGTDWAGVLDRRLEQALLILLLVSADFLASEYCYQVEVQRALELHEAGRALLVPVIVRPVDWKHAPFAHLHALPAAGRAITAWGNRDKAFVDVVSGIREAVRELAARPRDPAYVAWSAPQVSADMGTQHSPGQPASQRAVLEGPVRQSGRGAHGQQPDADSLPAAAGFSSPTNPARFGASFPEIWNVPRRHTAFFTGRSAVLDQLGTAFRWENEAGMISPQALSGLGGMGKTQVAAEYAYRLRRDYQAVLWLRAESQESMLADLQALARQIKLSAHVLHDRRRLLPAVQEWFRSQSDWLLIFDNVENPALIDTFLPRATRGHILATTRAGAVVSWARPVKLGALSVDDGALCILRRAGLLDEDQHLAGGPAVPVEHARQLSRLMEGLPLALEQAGAYINDTECGVGGYLKLYQHYRGELRRVTSGDVRDYPASVASVWMISRGLVEQQNPAAAELLRLCAFLASDGIPDELLEKGAPALGPVLGPVAQHRLALNDAIRILRNFSLINREVDRETDATQLSIHRIMQEILVDELDLCARQLWAERVVRCVEQASRQLSWSVLQAQAYHCQRLIEQWHMTFREARQLQQWIRQQGQN